MAALKKWIPLQVVLLIGASLPLAASADETAPTVLAASCVACHGTSGHSAGAIPSLVDLKAEEVERQLLAFRSEDTASTVMGRISKGYSDAEIAALAKEVASWEH